MTEYPLLHAKIAEGLPQNLPDPGQREPRCGPWDEQPDGSIVCRKCGDVDYPDGSGPMGF
jgi:hypothetical protein